MREAPEAIASSTPKLFGGARSRLGFTLLMIVLGAASALLPVSTPAAPPQLPPGFDLQGHRGTRGLMPENTLPAFEKALALGVTTLELDTVLTADGVLMVHHDRRLAPQRTRDASGGWIAAENPPAILSLTAAQLAAYDIGRAKPGSRLARNFPEQAALDGVHIPTLAAVVARAEAVSAGTIRYNIETKIAPDSPEDSADPEVLTRALIAIIREAGIEARAAVQSFDWRSLKIVQREAPEIATVYLTAEQSWLDTLQRGKPAPSPWLGDQPVDWAQVSVPQAVHQAGGAVWSPYYRDLTESDLRAAHDLGLRVVVWTVDEPADMAALIDRGVDGLITDYPDRARAVMAQKGLPLPAAFPGE